MNGFINHLIKRHHHTGNMIMPRLPGRFEQFNPSKQSPDEISIVEPDASGINGGLQTDTKNEKTFQKPVSDNKKNSSPSDILNIDNDYKQTLHSDAVSIENNHKQTTAFESNAINTGIDEHAVVNNNEGQISKNDNLAIGNHEFQEHIFENLDKREQKESNPQEDDGHEVNTSFLFMYDQKNFSQEKENLSDSQNNNFRQIYEQSQKHVLIKNNYHRFFDPNTNQDVSPVIKVSIGRIDVRAIVSTQPEKRAGNAAQKPNMSLEDYLKQRNGDK